MTEIPLDEIDPTMLSRPKSVSGSQRSGQEYKHHREILYYEIDDNPPWYLSLLLGFQHYITMAGSTISTPVILAPFLCMTSDDPNKANMISSIMFISGAVTLLQSTFGTRLPIIQGGSFSFIVVALAILGQPHFACPQNLNDLDEVTRKQIWQERMCEVQGAIIVASLFEVLIGFFGIVGKILKYITPMAVAPAITMIGLSLFEVSAKYCAGNWYISMFTILLIIIFSQYCKNLKIPIPFTNDPNKGNKSKVHYPVFQVFPVLLAIAVAWIVCFILTQTEAIPTGNKARTDYNSKIIGNTLWFRIPYPFQWGIPTVSVGAVLGMLAGVIAGTVESIGDYYACARISGASPPPVHAINRGIFIEGVGCVLAGIFGTGTGTTSLSQNIGAIGISKVGSRRVIQASGLIMIVFALIGKIGAVFVSIPEPIIGGIFCVVFATVAAVGLSNLQGVDLNSSRNIFVIGFSIFFGLTISQWMNVKENAESIQSGNETVDQIVRILLKTGMFISFFLGFVLDNTIPGTPAERGLLITHGHSIQIILNDEEPIGPKESTYDLPWIMPFIERFSFFKMLPISPTYKTPK